MLNQSKGLVSDVEYQYKVVGLKVYKRMLADRRYGKEGESGMGKMINHYDRPRIRRRMLVRVCSILQHGG